LQDYYTILTIEQLQFIEFVDHVEQLASKAFHEKISYSPGFPMNEQKEIRIIKKYPNRRIYDMEESRYITLSEVKQMIIENVEFKVVDAHSKKDITRNILLQIIIDQESEKDPLFSTENLQRFIRYYGGNQNQHFSNFLNQSLAFFQQQQEHFQSRMNEMLDQNPLNFWSNVGQQNMQMWQKMQQDWFSSLARHEDKKEED